MSNTDRRREHTYFGEALPPHLDMNGNILSPRNMVAYYPNGPQFAPDPSYCRIEALTHSKRKMNGAYRTVATVTLSNPDWFITRSGILATRVALQHISGI